MFNSIYSLIKMDLGNYKFYCQQIYEGNPGLVAVANEELLKFTNDPLIPSAIKCILDTNETKEVILVSLFVLDHILRL